MGRPAPHCGAGPLGLPAILRRKLFLDKRPSNGRVMPAYRARRSEATPVAVAISLLAMLVLAAQSAAALPRPDFDRPDFWFDDHVYHHHADLTTELQELASNHPQYVTLDSIGTSVRGRELWNVRITDPAYPSRDKLRIYVDGEHHGNEYLSGELAILLVHHLLEDRTDPVVEQVLRECVVWVTPMLNPDGNARDTRANVNGIDLNRNYPFEFTPGGSHGDTPASEPEVAANIAFMESVDLDVYLTLHTGIVKLVYPWGYTEDSPPDVAMYEAIREVSEAHGINYGQSSRALYVAHGSSKDWGYGVRGVPSFTYEVDDSQTSQISRREDIASRLSDELGLMMDLITSASRMRARLNATLADVETSRDGKVEVRVALENPTWTDANNTTVRVEVWDGRSVVASGSRFLDLGAGNSTTDTLTVQVDEEGDYRLRTVVGYPKLLVANATYDELVLDEEPVTTEVGGFGGTGGGGGLMLLLALLGVAALIWAWRRGWRPGWAFQRVRALVLPSMEV